MGTLMRHMLFFICTLAFALLGSGIFNTIAIVTGMDIHSDHPTIVGASLTIPVRDDDFGFPGTLVHEFAEVISEIDGCSPGVESL